MVLPHSKGLVMLIITIITSIFLSIFSTAVMSYISMATPIGPWIAPTLVLIALLFFKILQLSFKTKSIALAASAGSIGGILATAFGFSFPTLYFLDPALFNSWMAQPFYFSAVLTGLAFAAGGLGLWLANALENRLIVQEQLAFPIGQMVYKMIVAASNHVRKAYELMVGFVSTMIFCILQDGIFAFKGFIPQHITLFTPIKFGIFSIPMVNFDLMPFVWAIGFVTGHVIALPLAVGALAKIVFVDPVNMLFFDTLNNFDFLLAFCSGIVLSGVAMSFISLPKQLLKGIKNLGRKVNSGGMFNRTIIKDLYLTELAIMLLFNIFFLTSFGYSFLAQLYLIFSTIISAWQIVVIAGKIGLAFLGRFATFVMVPAMLLFNLNATQIVFIATFVEICGGVAADVLFGRKIAHLAHIDGKTMKRYQYLGLIVSTLSIGIVFWLLINHFGLGSIQLFAQRSQTRVLLIQSKEFNYYVLLIGALFGFTLKQVKINPTLVLGGLLMPINMVLGLVLGGLCTYLTKDKEEWYPFWSGVFASNSLWMLLKAII
jgi:OPT oligopeptide transporter protein